MVNIAPFDTTSDAEREILIAEIGYALCTASNTPPRDILTAPAYNTICDSIEQKLKLLRSKPTRRRAPAKK